MPDPFHLAIVVKNLEDSRRFYGTLLGCAEGRSTGSWVDFDFFGHQLSCHTSGEPMKTADTGVVDNHTVPMPHFGAVLGWEAFHQLAERLRQGRVAWVIEPMLRFEGQPGEQVTMFLRDPSGNAIEFKSYRHPEGMFSA